MTDDERRTRQPLSMTRRYRRGLILTGLLCALAVLTAATVLFQRSYAERIDNYLMQICHGYAAAYEAQDTHDAATLLNLLPENLPLRITLIDTDGPVTEKRRVSAAQNCSLIPAAPPTCCAAQCARTAPPRSIFCPRRILSAGPRHTMLPGCPPCPDRCAAV